MPQSELGAYERKDQGRASEWTRDKKWCKALLGVAFVLRSVLKGKGPYNVTVRPLVIVHLSAQTPSAG